MPGVYPEIWEKEVEKSFRAEPTFLNSITSRDKWVGNRVIHLTELGVDPEVLIDNTTYPIGVAESPDVDIPISLRKIETTNTKITDDELYGIGIDKIKEKVNQHKDTLIAGFGALAAHSLSPTNATGNTPVVETSGGGDESGTWKQLQPKDIIKLKKYFDDMKIPAKGRKLILCPEHAMHLLMTSQNFEKQYADIQSGKILNLYGFEIEEYAENTYYTLAGTKKGYKSVPIATDRVSSFAFYAPKAVKAMGAEKDGGNIMKMYFEEAQKNAKTRENVVGFRTYGICLPSVNKYFGAIVNKSVS